MKAYWINVDECIGRREFMQKQFTQIKCIEQNTRISAVTPENVDKYAYECDKPYKCDPTDTFFKGCKNCKIEHCALISHMIAIEKGLNDNNEWFIIFEDDTVIPHEIDWNSFFKNIPNDAEVLQLFCSMPTTVQKLYELKKQNNLLWIPWKMIIPSASGYVISRKGAKKIIDLYKREENKWCFSNSKSCRLADVMTYETCKTYTHTYPLFYPNIDCGSLIHPEHLQSHQLGVNVIKQIINNETNHPFATKIIVS